MTNQRKTLQDYSEHIAMGPFGSSIKKSTFVDEGVPIISGVHLHGAKLDESSGFNFITEEHASRHLNSIVKRGDVVFTAYGTLGQVAFVPENSRYDKYIASQRQFFLRPNRKVLDPIFLTYFFRSRKGRNLLLSNSSQVGVPSIARPTSFLRSLEIPIPAISEQKAIAHILGTLDDKIELNRQMNQTLEAMAQALFKSWFVDFDPVIDNALAAGNDIPDELKARAAARQALGDQRKPLPPEIQRQFPDKFVLSEEMGWIPEGWRSGCFGDVAIQVKENVTAENTSAYECYVGLEHIGRKQLFLADNGSGDSVDSNKSRFKKRDLLFGKLRPYFHKVCIASQDGICSTDILVFRARQHSLNSYMIFTAYSKAFVEYANMRSTGTRMPRANVKDMLKYPAILPTTELGNLYEQQTTPMLDKGLSLVSNCKELSQLRDTLLPKLISGELRVPEAEKLVGEAV